MRVTISGAAGCAAYIDDETLHFFQLANDGGWETAPISALRQIFMHTSDLVEIEVIDRQQAEDAVKRRQEVTHALQLLEITIASQSQQVANLSAAHLEEWLGDKSIKSEIEKYCLSTPLPRTAQIEKAIKRTRQPLTRALLMDISTAQPRIAEVRALLDGHLTKAAVSREHRSTLFNAFVSQGAFRALVSGHEYTPDARALSHMPGLENTFEAIAQELRSAGRFWSGVTWHNDLFSIIARTGAMIAFAGTLLIHFGDYSSTGQPGPDDSLILRSIGPGGVEVLFLLVAIMAVIAALRFLGPKD